MPATRKTLAILFSTMSFAATAAVAQTTIGVQTNVTLNSVTLKGMPYDVSATVAYPSGISAGSYLSASQLNSDFQGFVAAYPNAGDPPEAILSSVLASIMQKYPQIAGVSLSAFTSFDSVLSVGQTSSAQITSIQVFQGTIFNSGVIYGIANRRAQKAPVTR